MEKMLEEAQEQVKHLKSQNKISLYKIFDLQETINELSRDAAVNTTTVSK
jgi:hypothetical protein